MSDVITFTRHEDGSVTADGFPDEIAISPELLGSADAKLMRTFIEFNVSNGRAVYEVTGCEKTSQVLLHEGGIVEGVYHLIARRVEPR